MAIAVQWVKLKHNVDTTLRRGAWYKVIKLAALEAVVDVKGKPVTIPRSAVELAAAPPLQWSVVPSPKNAPRYPSSWGPQYAVCPNCRDRAALVGHPVNLRCARCNQLFDVAWEAA